MKTRSWFANPWPIPESCREPLHNRNEYHEVKCQCHWSDRNDTDGGLRQPTLDVHILTNRVTSHSLGVYKHCTEAATGALFPTRNEVEPMPIKSKPIKEIPEEAFQRRTRSSICTDTIEGIKASESKKAEITADTPQELDKFYKTLIQWRSRHKGEGVQFRKTKDVLYVWIEEPGSEGDEEAKADGQAESKSTSSQDRVTPAQAKKAASTAARRSGRTATE
jgi:hypothetical protein